MKLDTRGYMFIKQFLFITFLFVALLNNSTFAANAKKTCSKEDWRCHSDFYITVGPGIVHLNYTDHQDVVTVPGSAPIGFTTHSNFPNNPIAMRLGFGTPFLDKTRFGYEIAYNQLFTKSKTNNGLNISNAAKIFTADLSYEINPEHRVVAIGFAGTTIISNYKTIIGVSPNRYFSQTSNNVDVNPHLGAVLLYHINGSFAVKIEEIYDIGVYNKSVNSSFSTLLMLNYYPN